MNECDPAARLHLRVIGSMRSGGRVAAVGLTAAEMDVKDDRKCNLRRRLRLAVEMGGKDDRTCNPRRRLRLAVGLLVTLGSAHLGV